MQITIHIDKFPLRQDEIAVLQAIASGLDTAPKATVDPRPMTATEVVTRIAVVPEAATAPMVDETPAEKPVETPVETPREEAEPAGETKARRGRPKKNQDAASAIPAPLETVPAAEPPVEITPEMAAEFDTLVKRLEEQLIEGRMSPEGIADALKKWRAMGPAEIEKLREVIRKNDKHAVETKAAREKADAIRQEKDAAAPAITIEELRASLKSYTDKWGVEYGASLLNDFGCKRVSELLTKPADAVEFMKLCAKEAAKEPSNA